MKNWTGDMADVADLCGEQAADELSKNLPGVQLYIPKVFANQKTLLKLSPKVVSDLIYYFSGNYLYIHVNMNNKKTYMDTFYEIEKLINQGFTTLEIAVKLDISQSYVFKVRRKAGVKKISKTPDPRQLQFFE